MLTINKREMPKKHQRQEQLKKVNNFVLNHLNKEFDITNLVNELNSKKIRVANDLIICCARNGYELVSLYNFKNLETTAKKYIIRKYTGETNV